MKDKNRPPARKKAAPPDRLDETNTRILKEKVARKDPNPGNPNPPSA